MKKGVAIGGLILVTVIWGGGFVASDMALESMKPFQIMMVRFLLASVLMGLVSMGQRKKEAKTVSLDVWNTNATGTGKTDRTDTA